MEISSNAQLFQLVTYIHRNPEKHGLVNDFQEWPYSSYRELVTGTGKSHLEWDEVMGWFGTINSFKQAHQEDVELEMSARMV